MPRGQFLTTTSLNATRGCHNRCGFCYLSTAGLHMPYQLRDPQQIVEEMLSDGQPYAVFTDNNLGSRPAYPRGTVAMASSTRRFLISRPGAESCSWTVRCRAAAKSGSSAGGARRVVRVAERRRCVAPTAVLWIS